MKIRVLRNFTGAMIGSIGEERECDDEVMLADLLQAGYVEVIEPEQEVAPVQQDEKKEEQKVEEKEADAAADVKVGVKNEGKRGKQPVSK